MYLSRTTRAAVAKWYTQELYPHCPRYLMRHKSMPKMSLNHKGQLHYIEIRILESSTLVKTVAASRYRTAPSLRQFELPSNALQ